MSGDFNLSEFIRSQLTATPSIKSSEMADLVKARVGEKAFNKNSFSVAFYTMRKKLAAGAAPRNGRRTKTIARQNDLGDLTRLQKAADFIRSVGSCDVALDLVKQVQSVQL